MAKKQKRFSKSIRERLSNVGSATDDRGLESNTIQERRCNSLKAPKNNTSSRNIEKKLPSKRIKTDEPEQEVNPVVTGHDYCIDQLEIACKEKPDRLRSQIKRTIKKISTELALYPKVIDLEKLVAKKNKEVKRKDYKNLYGQGFRSIFRMACPTPEFFDLLIENEKIFGIYKPWFIELCKESYLSSKEEAIVLTDRYIDSSYKKNTTHTFIYDARIPEKQNEKKPPKDLTEEEYEHWQMEIERRKRKNKNIFGKRTLYLGESDFNHVVYARYSKLTGKPCMHMEWRFRWSKNYKRFSKIGIDKADGSYFSALKKLTKFNLEKTYEKLTAGLIKHAEIDKLAVGKQLMDCVDVSNGFKEMENKFRTKKKLSDKDQKRLFLLYNTFANARKIESTSHFVRYWQKYREKYQNGKKKDSGLHYSRFLKSIVLM